MSEIADFENMMSLDQPIKSSAPTRWERKQQSATQVDRFIPNRACMDRTLAHQSYADDAMKDDDNQDPSEYAQMLAAHTSESGNSSDCNNSRVLAFRTKAPAPKEGYQSSLKVLYSQQAGKKADVVKPTRHIPSAPVRILDAPDMLDDYCKYL